MVRTIALSFLLGVVFGPQLQDWTLQSIAAAKTQLHGDAYEKLITALT